MSQIMIYRRMFLVAWYDGYGSVRATNDGYACDDWRDRLDGWEVEYVGAAADDLRGREIEGSLDDDIAQTRQRESGLYGGYVAYVDMPGAIDPDEMRVG